MAKRDKTKQIAAKPRALLRRIWNFAKSRYGIASGIILGSVTLLGAIQNGKEYLTSFGLIDSKPLRIVSTKVSDNSEGAKVLEITLRNIGKEPIVLTILTLTPKHVVDLKPCTGSLVSALQISNKYDADISAAKADAAVNIELHQEIKGGEADRFQIVLESNKLNRLYKLDSQIISNENRNIIKVGRMAILYRDVAAHYLPDEEQLISLNSQSPQLSCYYYNSQQLVTQGEDLSDAATSALAGKGEKFRKWLAETLTEDEKQKLDVGRDKSSQTAESEKVEVKQTAPVTQTGIDCLAVSRLMQDPIRRATIRIVRRGTGPISQRHICSGFLMNAQGRINITTAAHCFFNRRTGGRVDPQELAVGLVDGSEFPIKAANTGAYGLEAGGPDIAFVELSEEISFKNFNDQCTGKK